MNPLSDNPWDYFPLAMCVNLRDRPERYEQAREELRRVGLKQVVFLRAERQEDRDQSCLDNHLACLDYAIRQGVPHVLVFEDDVQFLDGYLENMRRVVQFLQGTRPWKFFHLGGLIFRKVERLDRHFLRGAFMCVHAYVVRTDYARQLLEHRPRCKGISIDTYYTIMNRNEAYIHVDPLVSIQRASESDGTWDKHSVAKAGWLGQAMQFSELDWRGRLAFAPFTMKERIRLQNGLSFFKVYRHVQHLRMIAARRREAPKALHVTGEFVVESLNHPISQNA